MGDTSALPAIFLAELERKLFLDLIIQADTRHISAANVLETGIVLETRRGEAVGLEFAASPVRWPRSWTKSSCSRAMISDIPIFLLL